MRVQITPIDQYQITHPDGDGCSCCWQCELLSVSSFQQDR